MFSGRIGRVVVDAVAGEGEGLVAEQQHRRWYHLLPPGCLCRRCLALRERGALLAGLAVDDVVLLDDAGAVLVRDHMLDGDEGEAPAAPAFFPTDLMGGWRGARLAVLSHRGKAERLPGPHRPGSGEGGRG